MRKTERTGYNHGLRGVRALAHRQLRPYASLNDTTAYLVGYRQGAAKRRMKGKGIDYRNPLNNQFFGDKDGPVSSDKL